MLAPIIFGPAPSRTNNTSSSGSSSTGSASSSGNSTSGSTSAPSTSETPEPSYQEPETTAPGDIDDGTYEPTPAEETVAEEPEAPATETEVGSEPVGEAEEPVVAEGDPETAPDSVEENAGSDAQVDNSIDPMPPASEADQDADAVAEDDASSIAPTPPGSDRPTAPVVVDRGNSAEDEIEAAALAAYRGETVARRSDSAAFKERLTVLVDQSLSRGRDRALEVSQARIIAGLLSGTDDPQASTNTNFSLDQQRQPVDVAEAVRAYQQA